VTNYSYFSEIEQTDAFENGSEDAFELEACEPPKTEPERTEYLEGYAEGVDDWNQFVYQRNFF